MKKRLFIRMGTNLLLLSAIFLLADCVKEKDVHRDYPILDIIDNVQQGPDGVKFEGIIIVEGDSKIIDRGFVWSDHSNPDISLSRISIGSGINPRQYSGEASTDLFENTKYFVKAYARTEDYTVYSRDISFTSEFTKPPIELLDYSPNAAMWRDTVIIEGRHFSFLPEKTEVRFGEELAAIISCTDTALWVEVPQVDGIPELPVTVRIYEEYAGFEKEFHFIYPVVEDFYPKEGTFLDTIIIITSGLPDNPVGIQVSFGEHRANVLEYSENKFKVLVPEQIENSSSIVSTSLYGLSSTFQQPFILKPPHITGFVPDTIFMPGGTLTIYGANFNPIETFNTVFLNGISSIILSSTGSEIVIRIPEEIIEDPSRDQIEDIQVSVNTAGLVNAPSTLSLHYTNNWIHLTDFTGGDRYRAVCHGYNGKGYYGLGMSKSGSFQDLWEFDPAGLSSWTQKTSFPGEMRNYMSSFRLEDKIYLCCGTQGDLFNCEYCLGEVWVYDITQDEWSQMSDFPGKKRHSAFSFTIDGKGYLGGGNYGGTKLNDFWEYDPAKNLWTLIGEIPSVKTGTFMDISTFSDEKYGYILGNSYPSKRDFWKYDPVRDKWYELSSYPAISQSVTGFHIDGYIYAGSFYGNNGANLRCFRYSVDTDTWTSYLVSVSEKLNPDAMVIDNKGYILGGDHYYGDASSVWALEPGR